MDTDLIATKTARQTPTTSLFTMAARSTTMTATTLVDVTAFDTVSATATTTAAVHASRSTTRAETKEQTMPETRVACWARDQTRLYFVTVVANG